MPPDGGERESVLSIFVSMLLGFCLAVAAYAAIRLFKSKHQNKEDKDLYLSIEKFRSVGELVVYKILTKEIVRKSGHSFGPMGEKYFRWLMSTKKMAIIVTYDIDFRYDLRSPDFIIIRERDGSYRLKMPKCFYTTSLRGIEIYDEQSDRFMDWLLPGLISQAFGSKFGAEDKNELIESAKLEVDRLAKDYVQKILSEIQNSARRTLEGLSKGLGADRLSIDFTDSALEQKGEVTALLKDSGGTVSAQ
jgi:hypothetical protein